MTDLRGVVTPFVKTADVLCAGEVLESVSPTAKDRVHTSFTCRIKEIGDGTVIIGQGYMTSGAFWIEVTRNTVSAYSFYSYTNPNRIEILPKTELGFELKDFLTVSIDKDSKGMGVFTTVTTSTGAKRVNLSKSGDNCGAIMVKACDCELYSCKLNWLCDGYADDIWIFGDSYLGYGHDARWPYYAYRDGYQKHYFSGYAGMNTQTGLKDFKLAITRGTPIYALWLLGMNNGDRPEEASPNKVWLESTEEFLKICKEKGIIPVLATIPETPKVCNRYKSAWVKASGYRYIDFAHAVGSDENPEWYPGMLHTDLVHPASLGAATLYSQVLIDFPEIMKR